MEINIDFGEVGSPTGKQVDLVQSICNILHIAKPTKYTFDSYSDFITAHVDDYYYELEMRK